MSEPGRAAPSQAAYWSRLLPTLAPLLVVGHMINRVFHITCGLVCSALGLVHFAFGLQLFVLHHLAGRIFGSPFRLLGPAFHVLAIHGKSPSCVLGC